MGGNEQCSMHGAGVGARPSEYEADDLIGLVFESRDTAFAFYKSWGKEKGFDVRRNTTRKDKQGNIIMQEFCCVKEGHRQSVVKDSERQRRPKPSKKTGCRARVLLSLNCSGDWVITSAEYTHNHEMCEGHLRAFMRGHRRIADSDLSEAQALRSVGVRTSQIYNYFLQQKGDRDNVGFLPHDLYNMLNACDREELVDGDVTAVLSYFEARKDTDMGFFMKYTTDENRRLHNLFWCDSTSRSDYTCFGDVIAFDTTYKKNAYGRPLMPILGVNHHHQTVVFGFAVLANETSDTFEWVLSTFLEAMNQKSPISVVTDGDRAMQRAIKRLLPSARHRICSWHLSRNALQNISDPNFAREFTRCMTSWWTTHKFDQQWKFMVQQFNVADHDWVIEKDRTRMMWAQAYLTGHFFGTLRSTQRCESMNATLAINLKSKKTYLDFVRAIDQGTVTIRFKESEADYSSLQTAPYLCTPFKEIESHAAEIYTMKSFEIVQQQLKEVALYRLREPVIEILSTRTYYLIKYKSSATTVYKVEFDGSANTMHCGCKKLESEGFPCAHQLYVLKVEDMTRIPDCLIVQRWTKKAKLSVPTCVDVAVNHDMIKNRRFASLCSRTYRMNYVASQTDESFQKVSREVDRITFEMVDSMKLNDPLSEKRPRSSVKDPVRKRPKGKQVMDKPMTIKRCGHCRCEGHNKATCPELRIGLLTTGYEGHSGDDEYRYAFPAESLCSSMDFREVSQWT